MATGDAREDRLVAAVERLTAQQAELLKEAALLKQAAEFHKGSLNSAHDAIREHSGKIENLERKELLNGYARWALWTAAGSLLTMAGVSVRDSLVYTPPQQAEIRTEQGQDESIDAVGVTHKRVR
jgi:hypothetical protein